MGEHSFPQVTVPVSAEFLVDTQAMQAEAAAMLRAVGEGLTFSIVVDRAIAGGWVIEHDGYTLTVENFWSHVRRWMTACRQAQDGLAAAQAKLDAIARVLDYLDDEGDDEGDDGDWRDD